MDRKHYPNRKSRSTMRITSQEYVKKEEYLPYEENQISISNYSNENTGLNDSNSVSDTSSTIGKRYHKNYDANIELRQVNDRIRNRKSSCWAQQTLLEDEQQIDLLKYTQKLQRRDKSIVLEESIDVLRRKQTDIDKGKSKPCYQQYVYTISKENRKQYQPRTPNKFVKIARRAWDGMIKKWKKHIHAWNEPNFEDMYAAGFTIDCCNSETSSISSLKDSLGSNDDAFSNRDDFSEDEDTVKDSRKRKRHISNENTVEGNENTIEEKTLEAFPLKLEMHTGLTNDAASMNIKPNKRVKLNEISPNK